MAVAYQQYLFTSLGWLHIRATDQALTAIQFSEKQGTDQPNELTFRAACQLTEFLEKKRTSFDLPLEFRGTDFQKKVWLALQRIPYGHTITYTELALWLGDEKCIRAAAHASGTNPLLILVPCHRVVGSHGHLTGYAGGLWRKQKLLELEGALAMQAEISW
ncbi:methylated-DNA--[protein]-cysteine S-methyltransferase [Thermoflavifilum thermophilum]|uniref:methylated-DNA--[protein]-cysteine S-methyltransferase n=1 Tax=Thermoflavifilum thermophilum TaxID=1393122 RepID=A0A1I7NJQ2_9BACT|nr:methylated-DNA--[protein]-cysteine S-methyltransferase [Thermoflavifilum thermophilum]SFV34860.1 methylated-DNA-[protein]-cysteine S-methyltransferase [Thermoflavifilum thermophilum]